MFCVIRVPIRIKGKAVNNVWFKIMLDNRWKNKQKMSVAKMRMFRWMIGVNGEDRIRN